MKWITRANVKVDRVACPWLIKKFVDKDAEFLFVPAEKVQAEAERIGAITFDVPNTELGHHGKECSFYTISPKARASMPLPRASGIWDSRTTMRSTRPSGSSTMRSMPIAKRWS